MSASSTLRLARPAGDIVRTNLHLLDLPLNRLRRVSDDTLDAVLHTASASIAETVNLNSSADLYEVDSVLVALVHSEVDGVSLMAVVESVTAFWALTEVAYIADTADATCLCYASWCAPCQTNW